MKKIKALTLSILLFALPLIACGNNPTAPSASSVDVDLTALTSTMVYSEVFQMMYHPQDYVGKTIKMQGLYDHYHDDASGKDYYSCIIQDATACCAQGIEFQLSDSNYPEDTTDSVTVLGTFKTYEENGTTYCTLTDAELLDS